MFRRRKKPDSKNPVLESLLQHQGIVTGPLAGLPGRLGNTAAATGQVLAAGAGVVQAGQVAGTQGAALASLNLAVPVLSLAGSMGAAWATAAIPIVGPIIAGATLGLGLLFNRRGGKQKVAATQIVDQAEPLLKQNVDGYLQERTPEAYARAVQNFEEVWAQVVQLCSDPALGSAGQRCIQERGRDGRPSWGKNWFELYLDPITQNPPTNPSRLLTITGQPTNSNADAVYEVKTDPEGREHVVLRGTDISSVTMIGIGIAIFAVFLLGGND